MIITCNKCSTNFNLDDFLVKDDGSKVRCSVCKHIFTAYPLPRESEQEPEDALSLNFEFDADEYEDEDKDNTFEELPEFEIEDNDFSLNDSDLEMDDTGLDLESDDLESDDLESDDEFSFEENELDIEETGESQGLELEGLELEDLEMDDLEMDNLELEESPAEPEGLELEELELEESSVEFENDDNDDDIKFEADGIEFDTAREQDDLVFDETEDEFELEFNIEPESEDNEPEIPDDEADEISLELETGPDKEEMVLSLEENLEENLEESLEENKEGEEDLPVITLEDDFSEYEDVLAQETEPEDDLPEEKTIALETASTDAAQESEKLTFERHEPLIESVPATQKEKRKKSVGAPVLVLLLLFLLIAGAYVAGAMTGYQIPVLSDIKIPFVEQYLKKPAPEISEAKPVPNQKSVNGRFVTNATAGTLFVITGRVDNPSNIDYSHIEIQGALITTDKVEAKTKNAFCGNIITEEMLKTGNISDINTLLQAKEGTHNSNVNVKPGAGIPFMVVFTDLPEKLQNFTIKVTRFEKANKS